MSSPFGPGRGNPEDRTIIRPRGAAPTGLQPGTVLGHTYAIEALVARSSLGEVYRARHVELGTRHAIKVIPPALANNAKIVEMLVEEARKLAHLRHPAIVSYEGLFRDEQGLRYLVMEFAEGATLEALLAQRRLEPDEVLHLRDRLARGLAAAHAQGIVHRDISPKTIIVPEGEVDRAKLIDFAIGQTPAQGEATVIGSSIVARQPFAAPEQLGLFGGQVDARTDIYRLGLVLAAAALGFGKTLDMGANPAAALAARQKAPDLSALPAALRPVIAPMLSPKPEDRPGSMLSLIEAAPGFAAGHADAARERRSSRRWPILAISCAVALGVLGGGGFLGWRLLFPQKSEAQLRTELTAAVAGYQCADVKYDIAADRSVHLSGHVAKPDELDRLRADVTRISGTAPVKFDVELMPWPHCEVVRVLAPLTGGAPRDTTSLTLDPAAGEAHVGDRLTLDVRAPGFDGYVLVDYFSDDGQVLHLFPNALDILNIRPAHNRFVLFKPPLQSCWPYSGNIARQLFTLVVTRKPLFPTVRPELESAKDYLAALTQAVGTVGQGSGAASLLFVDLRAALPGSVANACASG